MKKLLAIAAVIVLLAAIFPAVTLAAQGNGVGLKLNNRMTTASAPLTATAVNIENCIGCGKCARACLPDALKSIRFADEFNNKDRVRGCEKQVLV